MSVEQPALDDISSNASAARAGGAGPALPSAENGSARGAAAAPAVEPPNGAAALSGASTARPATVPDYYPAFGRELKSLSGTNADVSNIQPFENHLVDEEDSDKDEVPTHTE